MFRGACKPVPTVLYTWDDDQYHNLMMAILTNLFPRFEHAGEVMYEELDEVNEAVFISKGKVDVGFMLSGKCHYVLRFTNGIMVAAYECTLKLRTFGVYKCKTDCEGYSIK